MPRNLELKVPFVPTPDRRRALAELGAVPCGVLEQIDTYFNAIHGRLKVRQVPGRPAELIGYARPDRAAVRASDYVATPLPDGDAAVAALSAALGVRVVVRKRRELIRWHNVRIHLDAVDGLGAYLEFEAELPAGAGGGDDAEAQSTERIDTLVRALGIDPAAAVAGSYADLLERAYK